MAKGRKGLKAAEGYQLRDPSSPYKAHFDIKNEDIGANNTNKCHKRSGHLFQNRYKSVICEKAPYFLELIRYIHLNPLRAKLVQDLKELDKYPWSGHSAVLGNWKKIIYAYRAELLFVFKA